MTAAPERTLVLLRHAKAERANGIDDELRPLAMQGRKQATRLGRDLLAEELVPEVVLCSSALRTRQTWELARPGLRDAEPVVEFLDALYLAVAPEILATVRGVDARVRTILVVAHEPSVSALAGLLADKSSDGAALAQVRAGVPTATYSVLHGTESWSDWGKRSARLAGVFRPQV